ncbi:MAG: hypothetical protein WC365_06530 [Candidatus Babeliales bacterium]|jgi:hypothetical protein
MKRLLIFGLILAPAFSCSLSAMNEKKEDSCHIDSAQQMKQINSHILQCINTFNSDGILSLIAQSDLDVLYQALMLGSKGSWALKRANLIGATKIAQLLEGFIIYYEHKHGLRK